MDDPEPFRLRLPDRSEYGDSPGKRDIPTWTDVRQRLEDSENYWLATTRLDGRPHVVPIGGVWFDGRLYLTMSPETVSFRNLAANPSAALHLENASEAVILHGRIERPPPGDVPSDVVKRYGAKYGGRWDPADPGMPFIVVTPTRAMTWSSQDIRGTGVRWRFAEPRGDVGH